MAKDNAANASARNNRTNTPTDQRTTREEHTQNPNQQTPYASTRLISQLPHDCRHQSTNPDFEAHRPLIELRQYEVGRGLRLPQGRARRPRRPLLRTDDALQPDRRLLNHRLEKVRESVLLLSSPPGFRKRGDRHDSKDETNTGPEGQKHDRKDTAKRPTGRTKKHRTGRTRTQDHKDKKHREPSKTTATQQMLQHTFPQRKSGWHENPIPRLRTH